MATAWNEHQTHRPARQGLAIVSDVDIRSVAACRAWNTTALDESHNRSAAITAASATHFYLGVASIDTSNRTIHRR